MGQIELPSQGSIYLERERPMRIAALTCLALLTTEWADTGDPGIW